MKKLQKIYRQRKSDFESKLAVAKQKSDRLVLWRPLIFLAIIGLVAGGFWGPVPLLFIPVFPLAGLFVVLVIKHQRLKKQTSYWQRLVDINETALQRLAGKWSQFSNTGNRFINLAHRYAADLNIFGTGSLFQYLNAATSFLGEQALADMLTAPVESKKILPRQQAINDLAVHLEWRQHFQALGLDGKNKLRNPEQLWAWVKAKPLFRIGDTPLMRRCEMSPSIQINNKYLKLLWILPVLTLLLLILTIINIVPLYVVLIMLALQMLVFIITEKLISKVFATTEAAVEELQRCFALLNCIEQQQFKAPLLLEWQQALLGSGKRASRQIKVLAKIADRMAFRQSPLLHLLVNVAVFWDLHTLAKLEKWKSVSGLSLQNWFKVIADFEAMSGLAGLLHDHPDWIFPEIVSGKPLLEARGLGHPLIAAGSRICNDIMLSPAGGILVITGSNMSGKSTFLRTVGINLVLAYAGAPVCAQNMRCSLMDIYSSIQLHDNLEQNTSAFYAELKRMKIIVDAARQGTPVIFLLDEIFKGTNSKDRIFCAKTVLEKLNKLTTIGLVTTHDLELGILEQEHPQSIKNYHFTDYIQNNKICFDYRIKPGVSPTTNAVALMKMIGIEV